MIADVVKWNRVGTSTAALGLNQLGSLVQFLGNNHQLVSWIDLASLRLVVQTHGRGPRVSPHNIKQVLVKFDLTEAQFREAYNADHDQPPQDAVTATTMRPN